MNKIIGRNLISSLENFKSEFLLIVERERERERISLLNDKSFSFDVNKFYNLVNSESLC